MIACKRNTKWSSPSIYWCPAINFAIESAMRLSEQLQLNWKHVDMEKRTAHLPALHKDNQLPLKPVCPVIIIFLFLKYFLKFFIFIY